MTQVKTRPVAPVRARQLPPRGGGQSRRRFGRPEWHYALMFLLPAIALALLTRVYPGMIAFVESLFAPAADGGQEFVGLDNYADALGRESFRKTIWVTLFFNVVLNPLQVMLAMALALLLTSRVRLAGLWRSIVFLPVGIPHVVSAIVWGMAMRDDGIINVLLMKVGIPAQPFLTSATHAIYSLMIITLWVGTGFWMIFLIAGLQDIPEMYYEAAKIDGAGFFRTFFQITLPMVKRPLLFVFVSNTAMNFVIFVIVSLLTRGGPQGSTSLIMYDVYEQAFQIGNMPRAFVEAVILLVLMLIFVGIQFRLMGSEKTSEK